MKKILTLLIAAGAIAGCAKEESSDTPAAVNFTASETALTRADAAIPVGAKANIWAYAKNADITSATAKVAAKQYEVAAGGAGTLTPSPAGPMYLPKGDYDFYSVGTFNGTGTIPAVTNGVASALVNATDYILAGKQTGTMANATLNIPFTYTHAASMVKITVTADAASTVINSISKVTITPSDPTGVTLNLGGLTPGISQAAAVTTAADMNVETANSVFTYIMLPLAASKDVTFIISANVTLAGQSAADMTFTGKITTPAGGFKGANRYAYTATVKGSDITFGTVKVTDWVETASGNIDTEQQ